MTLKFLSLKRFDPASIALLSSTKHKTPTLLSDFDLPPACADNGQEHHSGQLLGLQDAALALIISHLQADNSRQAMAALRSMCRRLRSLVNQACTTVQVHTDQVHLLGDLCFPPRGFTRCHTVRLVHRLSESTFPAQSIVKLAEAVGVRLSESSLSSAETPLSRGSGSTPPALLLTSSSSLASPKVRSRLKRRSLGGCNGCFFQQPVADDFQSERLHSRSLSSFAFPEPPLSVALTCLHLVYSSTGPPHLQPLLHACSHMPQLQQLQILCMHNTTSTTDNAPPTLDCNSFDMLNMVSSTAWDALPTSVTSLHLDVPYWETALPSLTHLTNLQSFHGDKKAHFQDLRYWRSPLPASLPDSVQDLRGLHVTTYADLLKLAALTRLTRLEFQSLNWDWNDPIMGGPNSLNIALKMLTALKSLQWLSIKQDSKASVVEKNTLEWLVRLGALERLELRGCKLFPEVLLPVVRQMGQLKSVTLDDCVDFHTGPGQNAWPELFQTSTLHELCLEVPGLHNTGPDFGGCALEKGIFQCFSPGRSCATAVALRSLHLGCVQPGDATWLLNPLSSLLALRNLSLALQDVTFQVASKLNILTQVTRVDLTLKLADTPSQPDITSFVSCLANPAKYHWSCVPLAPVLLTTVSSVREALRSLQSLAAFTHIQHLSFPIKVDWPLDRPLDPLHLSAFAHLCLAVCALKGLQSFLVDIQGVLPGNVDIYEPLMQLKEMVVLREGRVVLRDRQRMHVGAMFRLAVKRLAAGGLALLLQEPVADFRLGRSRVMSEPQKVFTLVPSIIC